jgi:hypothetical protein
MKLDTINVIEYVNDSVISVTSFTDDKLGNSEAEAIFRMVAMANGMNMNDADSFSEDGYFEQGTYQVFLTHST